MGSEMCIRDRDRLTGEGVFGFVAGDFHIEMVRSEIHDIALFNLCLLYTSDAADERSSVDLGGRRIIKKKNS